METIEKKEEQEYLIVAVFKTKTKVSKENLTKAFEEKIKKDFKSLVCVNAIKA